MLNLIMKDIFIQKKTLIYALAFTVLASTSFFNMSPNGFNLYVLSPIAISYMCIFFALSYDDKNKSEIVLNSLPLKRTDIVISKYISIIVFAAIAIIFSIFIGGIGMIAGLSKFTRFINFYDITRVLATVCIFYSIIFPVYFKFGAIKTQILTVILMLIPMLIFTNPNSALVEKLSYFVDNTSRLGQVFFALMTALIFFLISLLISLKVYSKKEF